MEGFHPWFSLLIIINDYIIVVTRSIFLLSNNAFDEEVF